MSERWKLGWLESYNAYTGEPERFVYRPGDDEHTRICVRGENCDEDARRIVASVNACLGTPTETLEAGVVVVPVEVAREYVESHRVPPTPNAAENQRRIERAIAATQRLDEHLAAALSRLQQNGGARR
ncbi:hypothetical protein [Symbiobacterium thermophilum]|uniref:hypothetical protein n=1 Tax=Symbiobacterium thermophilum TaxID=2734 RepID=UPI002353EB37|nr:hypothetical protein [Symbiobacterium thermophilum]